MIEAVFQQLRKLFDVGLRKLIAELPQTQNVLLDSILVNSAASMKEPPALIAISINKYQRGRVCPELQEGNGFTIVYV